jgi:hypothetical protein
MEVVINMDKLREFYNLLVDMNLEPPEPFDQMSEDELQSLWRFFVRIRML